jgi:hypothetical protein
MLIGDLALAIVNAFYFPLPSGYLWLAFKLGYSITALFVVLWLLNPVWESLWVYLDEKEEAFDEGKHHDCDSEEKLGTPKIRGKEGLGRLNNQSEALPIRFLKVRSPARILDCQHGGEVPFVKEAGRTRPRPMLTRATASSRVIEGLQFYSLRWGDRGVAGERFVGRVIDPLRQEPKEQARPYLVEGWIGDESICRDVDPDICDEHIPEYGTRLDVRKCLDVARTEPRVGTSPANGRGRLESMRGEDIPEGTSDEKHDDEVEGYYRGEGQSPSSFAPSQRPHHPESLTLKHSPPLTISRIGRANSRRYSDAVDNQLIAIFPPFLILVGTIPVISTVVFHASDWGAGEITIGAFFAVLSALHRIGTCSTR